MDDTLLVRGFERFGYLPCDWQRLVERNRALGDPVGQRRPFDELQDQGLYATSLLESVDRGDVGMI